MLSMALTRTERVKQTFGIVPGAHYVTGQC